MATETKGPWIEHDGQRLPNGLDRRQRVEVEFKDGDVDKGEADEFHWPHDNDVPGNDKANIMRYRLVNE